MRILWASDRIFGGNSAYTRITRETCVRFVQMGHKVAHLPMGFANRMGKQVYEGVTVYPSSWKDAFCEDLMVDSYVDFQADLLITLKEPWNFQSIHNMAVNYVPHAVVDHSPCSKAIIEKVAGAYRVIAISRHAQKELQQQRVDSTYIPHGVNTSVFKPMDKMQCRKLWLIEEPENSFVVGVVAMNRARKMIPRMLRGFKRFMDCNPDVKAKIMLWTNVFPNVYPEVASLGVADVGVNLLPEIMALDLDQHVIWPARETISHGIPDWLGEDYKSGWDMVKLYNCFDVLLLCSGGEGFGLPLIEAQSCGVPVVATNYAAAPENVGAGLVVQWKDYDVISTPGNRYALADIDGIADALTTIFNSDRKKLERKARLFASRRFDWNAVMQNYWQPFLDDLEPELHPRVTSGGIARWD